VSEEVQLRPYEPEDRDWFITLFTDPVVMERMGGASSDEQASNLFAAVLTAANDPDAGRIVAAWVAEAAAGPRLAHAVLLRSGEGVEIGFVVSRSAWGRGIATQVARELVRIGFDMLGVQRLIATVDGNHPASQRVLQKAGLSHVRRVEDDDGPYDLYRIER
jgi:RimJ/RimL family protein N-acetyltransferase